MREDEWSKAYQEARDQMLGLMGLLATYQSQEHTREFWELRDTIIPNREMQINQEDPAYNGNAKQATKALKSITTELIRIKAQYSDIFKKNSQIKLVEIGDPRPEAKSAEEIRTLKNYKALEEYVKKNNICKKIKLEKLSFEDAREICAIWAQYKAEWNVSPIEKIGTNSKIKETTLAHASGKIMEINSKLFDKENAEKNKTDIYERNVKSYADNLKAKIEYNKKQIESYLSILHNRKIAISAETEKAARKEIAKMQRDNKEHETTLNQGHTRHNVFISKDKVIENIVQHEFGHTIQDMLIGRNNDAHSMVLTRKQQSAMRSELIGLFNKYKNNCAWLSVYGTDTKEEFFAEGMVLYMAAGGAGMPEDVKNFYDKLKEIANM